MINMNKNNNLTVNETFELALQSQQKKNFQEAENLYNKILKVEPNFIAAHRNLGVLFRSLGEFKKAISSFEKIIEIDPNYINAHYSIGVIYKENGEYQKAKKKFEKLIEIDPNHLNTLNDLGLTYKELGDNKKAINSFKKIIQINPNYIKAHNNLGVIFELLGEYQKAISFFEKVIEINPNFIGVHHNFGVVYQKLEEYQKAINSYKKEIEFNPNSINTYFNLGFIFNKLGYYLKAINYYEKVIDIDSNYIKALNNLGNIFNQIYEPQKARECFNKIIKLDRGDMEVYCNLHGVASNIDEALSFLKKSYEVDNKHIKTKIMIGALEGYKGNFEKFNNLLASTDSNHTYARSVKWVFSLPKLPKIFFNLVDFYNMIIPLTDKSRPFYEFGVWNGNSFQYLINTFKKGFGFDTFTGLPESWHSEKKGTYTALGSVPKIKGGEFIVGKFEDTLPNFFSIVRPMASLINFDADLYSSTLCALNLSNKVIDEKTILVFDEFIANDYWEEDEYKALNEFCKNLGISYEVLAVSFFTKQVAVKLKRN